MRNALDPRQAIADRLIRPIREGKPELGWAGDPDLALVFARIEQRWELWRLHPDGDVMIMAGPPGAEINEDAINLLIRKLVEGDTHRSGNSAEEIVERVIQANERKSREATERTADAIADQIGEFYYEAGKAMGVIRKDKFGYGG